jgi:hypothetical protein
VRSEDVRVPAWFAIKRLGVTKQTFNYWRASGKITPDEDGEYRWGDVLRAELETRQSANSRRGVTMRPKTGAGSWQELNVNTSGMAHAS